MTQQNINSIQENSSLEDLQEKLQIIQQQHKMLDILMFKRNDQESFLEL